ncbi:MAG: hypothetical protein IMY73_02770, partial [Bacteroidetes bacterium]|nr:hypothetical protein [Bacteroidota bacterium]
NYDIVYTRYADDMSFSGDKVDVLDDILEVLKKYYFEINESKTRFYYKGNGQYVTGLSVEDSVKPRIPKRVKKRLRAEIYCISKYGLKSNVARILKKEESEITDEMLKKRSEKIIGWLSFINSIEYQFAEKYFSILLCLDDRKDNYYIKNAINHVERKMSNTLM